MPIAPLIDIVDFWFVIASSQRCPTLVQVFVNECNPTMHSFCKVTTMQ